MTIKLSNLQYTMLKAFGEQPTDFFMSLEEAGRFDQRPFRSMLIRKYVSYRPGKGFHITREGRNSYYDFLSTEIWRKNPTLHLTAYFDPIAYGIADPLKRKGKVIAMRGAA
jgi:hypothetical protein